MILVSACLCGVNCKYNGGNNLNPKIYELFKEGKIIPVCPEQLGGQSTPREPHEIINSTGAEVLDGMGKILGPKGDDATENFIKGANETLNIAKELNIKCAVLKARSPSCGFGIIYDGSFNGVKKQGNGVTAELLYRNGIKIYTEDEIDEILKYINGGICMNYKEMEKNAKENLNGSCRVCPVCNGIACSGEVPGMGGKDTASSFKSNVESLSKIKVNMRTIHDAKDPNMEIKLFGRNMSLPVFAAPVSGTTLNMGGKFTEEEYISWVIDGCLQSGIYPMVGDTAVDSFLTTNLEQLKKREGRGVVFIKPWENSNVIKKIKMTEAAGAFAVGMDIDACGLITLALHGKPVMPKTIDEIKEITSSTKLPFILKGIMTPDEAKLAIKAGADAIVVSNHGGRVLDHTPGVAEVLPEIAKVVKGKITILADGGVRSGVDILKMLALGADAVLIGRPFVTASFGNKTEGVKSYVDKLKGELKAAMILTGCNSIKDIDSRIIYNK